MCINKNWEAKWKNNNENGRLKHNKMEEYHCENLMYFTVLFYFRSKPIKSTMVVGWTVTSCPGN